MAILEPVHVPTTLKVMRMDEDAKLPTRGTEDSAGYDLYVSQSCILRIGESKLIKTGIAMAIPQGWYGQINPRSSVAHKRKLRVGARVIDSDYRGEILINIHNDSGENVVIDRGDRIAQIVLMEHYNGLIVEVDSLDDTARGEGGFGSTGV